MRWSESLAIGVPVIDRQHRRLFAQIDQLELDVLARDQRAIRATLAFLRDYAVEHFEAEERLMRDARYPGYALHKTQHDGFVSRLLALAQELEERGATGAVEARLQDWIGAWLLVHVMDEDQQVGHHVAVAA
jgi:hemerythrin